MERNIKAFILEIINPNKYPIYKIKEQQSEGEKVYTIYKKYPIIPIYHFMENCETLKEAVKAKKDYIEGDEERKRTGKKEERWVPEEEQFSEIL